MMATDSTIRLMDAVGEEAIGRVRRLLGEFAAEYDPLVAAIFEVQGFAAEVAGLPGRSAPPSGCLILAVVGDSPAGCVAMRDLGGGTCEMKRLYVAAPHRGRGVARLLVEAVLQRAEQLGYRRMVLDTLPEMAGAIALYRKYGFVATAPYWGHPAEHAVFLEKPLAHEATPTGGTPWLASG